MPAAASGPTALIRSLRIKCSSLNRLQKDVKAYTSETTSAQAALEKWRNMDPKDRDEDWEWNVKNAEKVVKDTEQMVPLTQEKVQAVLDDLKDLVETLKSEGDEEVLKSSEYETACKALETQASEQ
ncbi:hypothetical protein QFC22_001819 [Naganishia vaughanmartiniae]|uniref:Uncharacterized protein n=1 Tax=Naganishia vaughanmartiniae TaxID=1424756 RepID=A0ACC2XH81_9TREE|nr:hypothetical protein QFC22_001819 [Naganishia vaughanmartiniae]